MDRVTDFESGGCAFDPHRGHLPFNPQWISLKVTFMLIERLEHTLADFIWAQCPVAHANRLESHETGGILRVVKENIAIGFKVKLV